MPLKYTWQRALEIMLFLHILICFSIANIYCCSILLLITLIEDREIANNEILIELKKFVVFQLFVVEYDFN